MAKACEHKEVHAVDFKYIAALKASDHMVEDMLEKKIKDLCAMLAVPQLDLVLIPWPVPVSDTEYNRKERNRQAVTMRKTWSKLCTLKSTVTTGEKTIEPGTYIKNLGLLEVIGWQIEALCQPR